MLNTVSVSPTAAPVVSREATLTAARPALEALARRLVWDGEEARDVVQGALLEAVDRWETLRDPNAREGWLKRILPRWTLPARTEPMRSLGRAASPLFFTSEDSP